MAFLRVDLDDEQLKMLFRREYRGIRGIFRFTFSARIVQEINVFSYGRKSKLVGKMKSSSRSSVSMSIGLGEPHLLGLYRKPRLGIRLGGAGRELGSC